jgi:hypothetical protein
MNPQNGTDAAGHDRIENRNVPKTKIKTEYNVIYVFGSNLAPLGDNFYLSDIITKSSITMGKCSAIFKTHNFPS